MKTTCLCPLLLLLAGGMTAAPITGLVSTGVSVSGNQDMNWNVQTPGGTTPQAAFRTDPAGFPFGYWIANTANSSWISPQAGYFGAYPSNTDAAGGAFIFSTSFNLSSPQAWFSMQVMVDNQVTDIVLNGVSLATQYRTDCVECLASFQIWSPVFTVNSGFQSGLNTLEFHVFNGPTGSEWNPAGLRVEILESSQAPEPSTAALAAVGAALLGAGAWRRRRARTARGPREGIAAYFGKGL